MSHFRIRARVDEDIPALTEVLAAQRPSSRYPFRWPLPMPVADFLRRTNDERAWVATDGTQLLGHVAVGHVADDGFGRIFTEPLGVETGRMRCVTTLFTSINARGLGVGRALLQLAENDILTRSLLPVLDVAPSHAPAFEMYQRRGWRTLATDRPEWLPPDAPDVHYMALTGTSVAAPS